MTPIHLRNIPGYLITYDHSSILEHFAHWIRPERYLEIGVLYGDVTRRLSKYCTECYAIDIEFPNKNFDDNVKLFQCTSDVFFENLDKECMFDMVFIDGDHNKHQVYKDFINVKDKVIDDGFIFLHDSYPFSEYMTAENLCNNCYEAILKIKNEFNTEWEIVTLPFNPGLTIMKKMPIHKQLLWK
jgi:predicted O-methyltransferase YrrM